MAAINRRHFFLAFFFAICVAATKNSDEVREFIYAHRHDKDILTSEPAPAWVSSPNIRGTGDIIISCLVTLVACAYTAIHPTVPPGGSEKRSFMLIKASLVIVALFAPEAVFALAFQEYMDARRLKKTLKRIINEDKHQPDRCDACKRCERCEVCEQKKALAMVGMRFCYFVVMGGLQVDISDIKPSDHVRFHYHGDNMPETLPLSADGVIELAKLGHLDKLLIPQTTIEDKSKGALVQKCVVLIQVAWMGIQCIARKASGYPVSLLELHTFGHVLVAMLLYMCWLRKPLDVRQPVIVETDSFKDPLALMVQEQFCDLQNLTTWLFPIRSLGDSDSQLATSGEEDSITPANQVRQWPDVKSSTLDAEKQSVHVKVQDIGATLADFGDPEVMDLQARQCLPCGFGHIPILKEPTWRCIWNGVEDWPLDLKDAKIDTLPMRLTRPDRIRVERAARHIAVLDNHHSKPPVKPEPYARERFGSTGQHYRYLNLGYKSAFQSLKFEIDKLNPFPPSHKSKNQQLGDGEQPNQKTIDVDRKALCMESAPQVVVRYAAFLDAIFNGISGASRLVWTILSLFIGAIHLAAWNFIFPTAVESLLWKVGSVSTMVTMPAVLFYRSQVVYLQRYHFQYHRLGFQTPNLWLTKLLNICYFIAALVFLVYFAVARAFLIIESFISVRRMSYGVYFVPDWLQIFPHI